MARTRWAEEGKNTKSRHSPPLFSLVHYSPGLALLWPPTCVSSEICVPAGTLGTSHVQEQSLTPYRVLASEGHFLSVLCLLRFCFEALEPCLQFLQHIKAAGDQGFCTPRLQDKNQTVSLLPFFGSQSHQRPLPSPSRCSPPDSR